MNFPMNIEQWRLIGGYDNYEVSSHGRVRNNKTNKIMKQKVETKGYLRIGLTKDNKQKFHRVHRLVGLAFLDKKDEDKEVDHIDHNKSNNMLNNLRWVTGSINCRNKTKYKNNTTGMRGVNYDKKGYWTATWSDDNKKNCQKAFSVKKYGNEEAKQLAINYRKERAQENGYINV